MEQPLPRIAVLVDLSRGNGAGGHVKYWECLAQASAREKPRIDLTVYFSGEGDEEILSSHVRFRFLKPVFSTARLGFLPYVPAHTDLASFHPQLAKELASFDIIHATDGFFAFAQTAERVSKERRIPLVSSFHTDTPAYAELFTRQTLLGLLGRRFGAWVDSTCGLATRERRKKEARLKKHLKACAAVLALRPQDVALARAFVDPEKVTRMRLGVDKETFLPNAAARAELERLYSIDPQALLLLFVGRIDAGKNMPLLLQACAQALAEGINLHLIVAGLGPMSAEVEKTLGIHTTGVGMAPPEKLAVCYAGADCLCMASEIEIGGLVGAEALASGCPLLVSESSGVAALYGGSAAVVSVENTATAWARAFAVLAADRDRLKMRRALAREVRDKNLAAWQDVLNEDFMPVWLAALRKGTL